MVTILKAVLRATNGSRIQLCICTGAESALGCTGVKFPLDKAAEAVKKAMDGVGGQGKVMLEDKFSASEE